MTVRLLSTQIPQYWEYIKYALAQVERFGSDDESLGAYNRVFAALLNDKSQCFVMSDEDGTPKALLISEIYEDQIRDIRSMHIRCLYAFKVVTDLDEWGNSFAVVRKIAEGLGCKRVTFQTRNARIVQIGKSVGFNEKSTNLELEI